LTDQQSRYKSLTALEANERQRTVVKRVGQVIVFIITMASTLLSFTAFGVAWPTIVIAVLSLGLLLSLLGNALYFIDARNRRGGPKQIAFITPSSGGQPFYATMLGALVRSVSLALGQNYILVPSMPAESFEAVSIWALFASLEDRQLEIDGIIFIPDQPDRHFDELVGFHEKRGDIPLVLVDVYFNTASCDARTLARLPSFVGGDEIAGGRLAAELVVEAVGLPQPENPVVLVINGGSAPWEQQRSTSFKQTLRESWPDVSFLETGPINYSRSVAFELSMPLIRSLSRPGKQISLDAIFACNDDMAIGARAAVSRLIREGYTFVNPPQIVGYDGISEIREFIQTGDPFIAGTVEVRIEEQANEAMLLMHKLVRSGQRRSEVRLIAPRPVRRG
jgi:ABC-type sugar transport system substrate-binding protein